MKDGEETCNWHGRGKSRSAIIAGGVLLVALLVVVAGMMRPGRKLWYMVSAQETYRTYRLRAGQYCSEAKEPEKINADEFFSTKCYAREPAASYTSILFEQRLQFILYGEVERIKNYVIEGEAMRDGKEVKPVPYYCHVITVRVSRGIYGSLDENQRVNLLCKWKHEERDASSERDWEYVKKGDHGIFLVEGNVARIRDQERGEGFDILGKIPHERGSRVVECKKMKGLGRIGSKEEAVDYFLKHRIVTKPEE